MDILWSSRKLLIPTVLLFGALLCVGCTGSGKSAERSPNDPAQSSRTSGQSPKLVKPLILYTDVTSGPNSGGEHNQGAYLSIFGKDFGTGGLGHTVKVYIGAMQVNNYRYLGPSRGRPGIQQITVQIGHLGNPKPGIPLPIRVVVNGKSSNTNRTFTVNPGRMLFVSQTGNDATAIPGDIKRPYRYVQNGKNGAFDVARPGDTIVMLGTPLKGRAITSDPTLPASAWTDTYQGYFLRFIGKDGTAPTGRPGSGPISLIAYPDQDVFICESYASGAKGAITGVDTTSYPGGRYVTVADLRIESGGPSGVVNEQIHGHHWRVVNNELTAATGATDPHNLAGGITGNGNHSFWVGNHIHAIYSASPMEMHGIYIDGNGSYKVAYNWINNVRDGSGFQVYVNGDNGSNFADDVTLHHNLIGNIAKYGINVADGSRNGFLIYDNVVFNAHFACLRFNTNTLHGARIYNNTFVDCGGVPRYGVVTNDWVFPHDALDMENNIIFADSGGSYAGGTVGMYGKIGRITHNLFYNGHGTPDWDSHPIMGDPRFISLANHDFRLRSDSAAIDAASAATESVVTSDFDFLPRASGAMTVGAYSQ